MKVEEKICLIIPPSIFLLDERVFPSLGILKVASSLEARDYNVDVLDLSGYSNFEDILEEYCSQNNTRIFGITTTTPQMPASYTVAKKIRSLKSDSKLIIGGPHPTLISSACKRENKKLNITGRAHKAYRELEKSFDVIVAGDGEDAIFEAIKIIVDGKEDIRFVDGDDPKTSLFLTDKTLELTPWPARHLIDLDSYHYQIEGKKSTSLISQLGCPFMCAFCGGRYSPMLRRIRSRSTQNVVDEIKFLHEQYGYTGFMFYDDELNVNKEMIVLMNSITDLQSSLGVDFRLRGFVKSELFSDEQAKVLHRAGFRQLLTGFESGSERILSNIDKKATKAENFRAVKIAKDNNLKVKALMSIGHAGESIETIQDTKQWLLDAEPDDFDCTIITTYPGTPYYDDAVETSKGIWTYTHRKTNDRLHAYELDYNTTADYYKGDPDGGYKAYVFTDYITSEQLVIERDKLEKEVREKLNIPFNAAASSVNYEHSMGQGLPANILRRTCG